MIETILSGLAGGILRIVPEVMKLWDAKNERAHELSLLEKEMEFAKVKAEAGMRETEAQMTMAELDAMAVALREQGETARAAGQWVAAMSALVRPLVTYWFVGLYSAYKMAAMYTAHQQGAPWDRLLVQGWSPDDQSMLTLVLTFWFVGRVWERLQSKG